MRLVSRMSRLESGRRQAAHTILNSPAFSPSDKQKVLSMGVNGDYSKLDAGKIVVDGSSTVTITRLTGNADIADKHLSALRKFAIGKPFEFHDLVIASRNLQTFGFQVSEVQGLLQDFGDAAFTAGTGIRGVNSMVNVFGTIRATQKVTFGQLRQLVRAGIPAFDILREQLHLTDQQLRNIAHSTMGGQVVIDALRRGMQQRFANGMADASRTITARLSDLQDVAGHFMMMVGRDLRPTINGFLVELSHLIANADFELWARRVSDALATLALIGRIALAPLMGAFSDIGTRWNGDVRRTSRPLMNFLGNVRDVVQGVAALLSSEGTDGIGRIPARMHATLMKNGLWPLVLRIAQWGNRVRSFIGGFVGGVLKNFDRLGKGITAVAGFFGLAQHGMALSSVGAHALGGRLADLFAGVLALRVGLAALSLGIRLASAAQMAFNVVMSANPIGLAVVAVLLFAGVTFLLIRYWDRLAAGFRQHRAVILATMLAFGPLLAVPLMLLSIPVAIAYVVTHWRQLHATVSNTVDAWRGRIQLVRDALSVTWALISTGGRAAFASVRASAAGLFGMFDLGPVMARLAPLMLAFATLRKWVSGEMKGLSSAVSGVFDSMVRAITGSLRGLAGDLVAAFRSLPEGLRPAGLGGAVERLDAFARGPQQPVPGSAQPAVTPTPGAPTAPQLIVQRTAAQARGTASGGQAPAPVVHVTNAPAPTIVQIDGREVARTVARHQADEHMRGGGAGSDDT